MASIIHLRKAAGKSICGLQNKLNLRVVRNRGSVTCGNCLKLMRQPGYSAEELAITTPLFKLSETQRLILAVKSMEAQIASLTDDYGQLKAEYEKALNHADHIQNLAAEGKDPLSGEEPEFWVVWRQHGQSPVMKHPNQRCARMEAERLSSANIGVKFYILPAFDYAVCEVNPVVWKRKSREDAIPRDDEEVLF